MTLSSNVCLWLLPEDGSGPIHIDGIKEIMISECEDPYPYTHETIRVPHVEWFFTFKAKPSIEELAPRYFKRNNEKNMTCVWSSRTRVIELKKTIDTYDSIANYFRREIANEIRKSNHFKNGGD